MKTIDRIKGLMAYKLEAMDEEEAHDVRMDLEIIAEEVKALQQKNEIYSDVLTKAIKTLSN